MKILMKNLMPNMFRDIKGTPLLHEAEKCMECSKTFLSLYPIRDCNEHEGLETID